MLSLCRARGANRTRGFPRYEIRPAKIKRNTRGREKGRKEEREREGEQGRERCEKETE